MYYIMNAYYRMYVFGVLSSVSPPLPSGDFRRRHCTGLGIIFVIVLTPRIVIVKHCLAIFSYKINYNYSCIHYGCKVLLTKYYKRLK